MPEVTNLQVMLRQVASEDDDIEHLQFHHYLGCTVTSLTPARVGSSSHTVTTRTTPTGRINMPGTVYFRPNGVSSIWETSPLAAKRRSSERSVASTEASQR